MTERGPSIAGWPWRIQATDYVGSKEVAMALPDSETIERAFQAPVEVIEKLPESTESRRALDLVKLAERYTKEARERAKAKEEA